MAAGALVPPAGIYDPWLTHYDPNLRSTTQERGAPAPPREVLSRLPDAHQEPCAPRPKLPVPLQPLGSTVPRTYAKRYPFLLALRVLNRLLEGAVRQ